LVDRDHYSQTFFLFVVFGLGISSQQHVFDPQLIKLQIYEIFLSNFQNYFLIVDLQLLVCDLLHRLDPWNGELNIEGTRNLLLRSIGTIDELRIVDRIGVDCFVFWLLNSLIELLYELRLLFQLLLLLLLFSFFGSRLLFLFLVIVLFLLFVDLFLKFGLLALHISFKFVVGAVSFVVNLALNVANRHEGRFAILPFANHILQDYVVPGKGLFPLPELSLGCLQGDIDHHLLKLLSNTEHECVGVEGDVHNLAGAAL
jgi:hypothetical protein